MKALSYSSHLNYTSQRNEKNSFDDFYHTTCLFYYTITHLLTRFAVLHFLHRNKHLTTHGQNVHNDRATPHCVVGLGGLFITRRTTALRGFFVRAVQSYLRYGGLNGDTFGCAGSCVPVRQPRSVHHHSLAAFGDGLQPTHKRLPIMANGFLLKGEWCFKLPNPFNTTPYLPISGQQLAEMLQISTKTAVRICQSERQLKEHELVYLQMKMFGYIPDPDFLRYRVSFRKGHLYSHNVPNFEMSAGQVANLYLWKTQYLRMEDAIKAAKERIKELEAPAKPTNIIDFKQAKAKRQAFSQDWEA